MALPLRQVGWQACLVDLEEALLLGMAATLLVLAQASPTWLKDGIVWMFPLIIATMLVGDALTAGAKMLRLAWQLPCRLVAVCRGAVGRAESAETDGRKPAQ